ncbi:uncharacterized protein LOC110271981 [Arachis ipaensis]|uniref:uncharacterized protein LOC110271981 n=1 Tax=Arachis ipaensis TaxID=130454 RepID=UPI000A2B1FC3|nr:uncharacterized protein LOC110271981 [Arachis ipaensis]XP_025652283.1 uncharacterized protein LOC112748278 [Arachis hypogaea]
MDNKEISLSLARAEGLRMLVGFSNGAEFSLRLLMVLFMSEGLEGPVVARGYYLNSMMVNYSDSECQGYMLLAASSSGDEQDLSQIPVVSEFFEVFSKDILEFPPREIEFAIELIPGAGLILIAPYRMSSLELAELKGAPVLLVNKKDDGMRLCVDYRVFRSFLDKFVVVFIDDIREDVKFLGACGELKGNSLNPAKDETLTEWGRPTSVMEVISFLRLADFYRRFIKDSCKLHCPD